MNVAFWQSPLGRVYLSGEEGAITHLGFVGQLHEPPFVATAEESLSPVLAEGIAWLERYFSGAELPGMPLLRPAGTDFQLRVWELLRAIPHGKSVSYGELAMSLAKRRGSERMSAQAVGQAVGRNPIAIMIPCHRVLGADGSLTGYAGGVARKRALLELEGIAFSEG